ncbi:Xylulokinase [Mycolicibacterium smegmatis]|nr:Xylulokinase [Mycolicibacterium smegmatis]
MAGIDSSTQSCKIVVCDADSGSVVRTASSPHPGGTEVDPGHWWDALQRTITAVGGLDDVEAVSVGAQQHGMVCLNSSGQVVRDALLWNDTRSASSADDLVSELGGPDEWAKTVGVVPVAAITATKLRWLADNEPENADATAAVCLPHDWLGWRLTGSNDLADLRTDRSDASGTGYFSAETDSYRTDLLELAMRGRTPALPTVLGPRDVAGRLPSGAILGPGAGDNAAAALGLGAGPGDCIVSLGTSGVVSAVGDAAPHDPEGIVAGFADASGRQLPLVCTLNGAPVLAATAAMLQVDFDEFDRLALSAPRGADGLTLVPYLEGGNGHPTCLALAARCTASRRETSALPTSPAPGSRACWRRWRSASTRSSATASTSNASSWSAAAPVPRPCGASPPRSGAGPSTSPHRASTSRWARPGKRHGLWGNRIRHRPGRSDRPPPTPPSTHHRSSNSISPRSR